MNLHEYQAKQVLAGFGVPVPRGVPVLEPEGIEAAVDELGGPVWVVKAQIHAGGRGKAGGVKVCSARDEAIAAARVMFGKVLVTHQTGPAGKRGAPRLSGGRAPTSRTNTISAPWWIAKAGASP